MNPQSPLILVIDDEPQIRRLLRLALETHDYRVAEAENGRMGIAQAGLERPDAVLLDLGLPDMSGEEVLRNIRTFSSVPVIILTVRDAEKDKIAMLDGGADDYLTKPFSTGELFARIRVALRHAAPTIEEVLQFATESFTVDFPSRTVTLPAGDQVKLTATEYDLLCCFIRHAGKVLTHRQILREVWGHSHDDETQYLRVYVGQLRKKLERNPAEPQHFQTEIGVGYRFEP